MKARGVLAVFLGVLAILACSQTIPSTAGPATVTTTPSETITPRPSRTPRPSKTVTPAPIVEKVSALQAVNVRESARESSASLGVLYSGASVVLTGECSPGGWAEIVFGAERAWIRSRYISGETCKEEE
jgi:hypothetical protein